MSLDESTAKGLTKRFQREVAKGIKRYSSKYKTLPVNARPKAQPKLVQGLMKAAGPAGAFLHRVDDGLLWGIWKWVDIKDAGSGYVLTRFYWPERGGVEVIPPRSPTFVTHHAVQRIAQAYLDAGGDVTVADLGEHIDTAMYPIWAVELAETGPENAAITDEMGDCWVCDQNGCLLVGTNEHHARVVKTYIDADDWDDRRHKKWDRYLDDETNVLIAEAQSGDLLNVLHRGERSDGARVGIDVARFNLRARGLEYEIKYTPPKAKMH